MGWLYSNRWDSKLALLEYLRGAERWGSDYRIVKSTVRGNRHWYVGERLKDGVRFIGLDLIASGREHGWGYKDMDESCGPCYYDCPLGLLDLAPNPPGGTFAEGWRDKVRAHHARRSAKPSMTLTPGLVVTYGGHQYRLQNEAGPRKGWYVNRESDGRLFRMNARQLAQAVEQFSTVAA